MNLNPYRECLCLAIICSFLVVFSEPLSTFSTITSSCDVKMAFQPEKGDKSRYT